MRYLFLLICSVCYFFPGWAQTVVLSDPKDLLLIGKQVAYLEDPTGKLGIADILSPAHQSRFVRQQTDVFNRTATTSAYWFKFTIQNTSTEDAWLEIGTTFAWYIDFYAPDSSGRYGRPYQTGTMLPEETKCYDVNVFWLPLNKAGDQAVKTYYVRVVEGLLYELPLQVGTIRSLHANKDLNDYLTSGFVGLMLVMFLYNLFLYLSTRDRVYISYLGYMLTMGIAMPYANSYPFIQYLNFGPVTKELINEYFLVWHCYAYMFVGIFCIHFLELGRNKGYVAMRIIQGMLVVIVVVFSLLNLAGVPVAHIVNPFQLSTVIMYFICIGTAYYFLWKGDKQALLYVGGWTFLIISVVAFYFVVNGLLPYTPVTRNALYFGTAMEAWMFSLALGNRLNLMRQEKEAIQVENLRLTREQNVLLEEKVLARTIELEEANQTKTKLFSIIGHDLRGPINSFMALFNLIEEGHVSRDEFQQLVPELQRSVNGLRLILENLLSWSSNQMMRIESKPKDLDVRQIADEHIAFFGVVAMGKNIRLRCLVPEGCYIWMDEDHLRLVLRNLISNAIKFTPANGCVEILTEEKPDQIWIIVKDDGIGMSPEKAAQLFNPQAPVSERGTAGERGTGLGLNLCKEFVEKNQGKIWVESSTRTGSKFIFSAKKTQAGYRVARAS